MSDTYKFEYFNARGLGEITRYLFALAGKEFEDFRYPLILPNFDRPEYEAARDLGEFRVNMDRVPVLTINGTLKIGQSRAIERYLAKKFGFFGSNEIEELLIDAVTEHLRDIKQKYNDAKVGKSGEDLTAVKTNFVQNELPKWLDKLEYSLGKDGYAVGGRVSLADVIIFNFLTEYFDAANQDDVNALVAARPSLAGIVSHVEPLLASYRSSRPQSAF
mmetsp:Transcript_38872/g.28754  ORF Transcript_38872/g.28754 Transcript_38872/m.28754 type:complete len:218 (+) Transcript_38872:45-698(+)